MISAETSARVGELELRAENIHFAYHTSRPVLSGVGISVRQGEWLTLLGPNGTGKTTLLKCLLGQLSPQQGTVRLDGTPLTALPERERAKRIAYVPQMTKIPFAMPVVDAVLTGRLAYSPYRYTQEDRQVVARVMEQLHLHELAFRPINELSGGERQRVWIARALAQEAKLIFLDEPTTGLDPENQIVLLDTVRRLVERGGVGVLTVLHDLNLAAMYSDRVALLSGAHMFAQGAPTQVITEKIIREVYHVDNEVLQFDSGPHVRLLRGRIES